MAALATWFTPELHVFSRAKGASAVAKAAYRACQKLYDKYYQKFQTFKRAERHVKTELFGDHEMSINDLWDKAEESENRKNSSIARELMIPLPDEWTDAQRLEYCQAVVKMLREKYKVAGQLSIHRPDAENPNHHVHILFTTRQVISNKFEKKTRILDEGERNGEVKILRETIAEMMNEKAIKFETDFFVTGGKFNEFIPDHIPTINIPHNAHPELRARLEEENRQILRDRAELKNINTQVEFLDSSKEALQKAKIEYEQQNILFETFDAKAKESEEPLPEVVEFKREFVSEALEVRHKYETVDKAFKQRTVVIENIQKLQKQINNLKSVEPTIKEKVVNFVSSFVPESVIGVNTLGEREKKIEELLNLKNQLSSKRKNLTQIIENPENSQAYMGYKCNPNYREAIKEYEATLPDAPKNRKPAVKEIEQQKIEPVRTPGPDYSDSPFYIKNPWDSDFRP